ncbi:UNVERIFIED_CONTAM: hypothetical protein FKN15_069716 [Acipenser sinensis]
MKTKWYCTLETPPPDPVLEECEEEGALYTVTRRQQQSQHSATRGQPRHGDGVGHSETCLVRYIKAGTVDRLVLHLLDCFRLGDSSYVSVFLSTYRTFSSPEQALRILLDSDSDSALSSLMDLSDSDPCRIEPTDVLGFPASVIAEQLSSIETLQRGMEYLLTLPPSPLLSSPVSDSDSALSSPMDLSDSDPCRIEPTDVLGFPASVIAEQLSSIETECRARKNFSSLYAIISALQSNGVHRLKRTWEETSRDAVRSYEELSEIFSEEDNYSHSRELLKEVVTPHPSPLTPPFTPHSSSLIPHPSHLMGDAVRSYEELSEIFSEEDNYSHSRELLKENGYINFDKRRKEFEIIAQIRLLQSSCKNSTFQTDESFMHWYSSLPRLSEAESPAGAGGFKAWDKLLPLGSPQGAGEGWSEYLEGSDSQLKPVNPLLSRITKHMKSPSVSCLDAVASAPGSNHTPSSPPSTLTPPPGFVKSHRRSASCGSAPPPGAVKAESDMRIIRVEMGLEDGNMYRSILVSSNDKAPTVISKALEKHNQDPSKASQYELVQVLPEGKELTIPSTGNVFYAMTSSSMDFLLRKKGMASPQVRPVSSDLSATFPRIKSKGLKIARAFF